MTTTPHVRPADVHAPMQAGDPPALAQAEPPPPLPSAGPHWLDALPRRPEVLVGNAGALADAPAHAEWQPFLGDGR